MDDESGEQMEPMEEMPRILQVSQNWSGQYLRAWLTERSRELIPEKREEAYWKESVIRRENDVNGRASVG